MGRRDRQEDQRLIAEAQQSSAAFAALYKKYQRSVFRFFKYRLGDVEDAWDSMQETFLRAFSTLKKYNDRGFSYLTYLLRIARNLLVDNYRKPTTMPLETAEQVPDHSAHDQEIHMDAVLMWKLADKLSPSDQYLLRLFYQQEKSIATIAAELRQTPNAVKLRLSRARVKLRQLADRRPPDDMTPFLPGNVMDR